MADREREILYLILDKNIEEARKEIAAGCDCQRLLKLAEKRFVSLRTWKVIREAGKQITNRE